MRGFNRWRLFWRCDLNVRDKFIYGKEFEKHENNKHTTLKRKVVKSPLYSKIKFSPFFFNGDTLRECVETVPKAISAGLRFQPALTMAGDHGQVTDGQLQSTQPLANLRRVLTT